MSKYLTIYRTSFRQETKTLGNFFMRIIVFAIIMYMFLELWSYIYGGSGTGKVINGYSLNMMLWYLITTECVANVVKSRAITNAFSNDIKLGTIAYKLNKPYNYYFYQLISQYAGICFKMIAIFPVAVIIGLVMAGPIYTVTIANIFPMIVSFVLAVFLNLVIYGLVGLLAFWIEEVAPITWIVSKFPFILGLFFPMEFFPLWVQGIIKYSPVYSMMSGPATMVANFSWNGFLWLTVSQIAYIVFFIVIALIVYNRGTRKVNLNGG